MPGQLDQVSDRLQQEELIQNLLDAADTAIYGMDLDGRCTLANPACARLLGYGSPTDLTGRSVHALVHPRHEDGRAYPVEDCPIHRSPGQPESTHRTDQMFWRADGTTFHVEYWAQPVWEGDSRVGTIVAFRDISREKALEAQLLNLQRVEEFGHLAGGVTHDFNNMLTVISGYCELLLGLTAPDDPKREYLHEIRKAGKHAASLTRQLFALYRTEGQPPRELDLNGVIRDMEKFLRRIIGEDVVMSTSLNPDLNHIVADPSQIEQVLLHLMINARDAMPLGGELRLETDNVSVDHSGGSTPTGMPPGQYVRLSVADSGAGMSDFVKSQLFEPFFTTKPAGTGLGLPVVREIVSQGKGFIDVESKPGEGTVFHIYLPYAERTTSAGLTNASARTHPRGMDTILLVEDDDAVRAFASYTLREQGYTVLEAANASEALRICAESTAPIHLLVTDVVMPVTSGRILAETLSDLYPHMRILFISGYTDDAVLRHGILHDQVAFLPKPFSAAALAAKVADVLAA